ncbi:hypothetical protein BCR44DRAFT_1429914 [Catenaria anguillulae PL171]|uniref:Uncharacterized protein n=1 Tax=Catenaria anguillulae PL171 TaxID=765915 RepID=A0A1Y2HT40_9FUNG|nr:hypothetical protein BCR44DRAFT_1429914 [Catenaria anguillulae PL171]
MLSGIHAQQQGDITGSSDEDLDRFYDAHAEAYAAETLSRQHGTLRASRDLSRDSPLSSTSSSFPSERVSVIHSRNASPTAHALAQADDGASTRAMQVGSPSTPQIHPPRRVDSLLAPTLASLAAGPASRHPTPSLDDDHDLDNSHASVSPPATMIAAAEAAAIPRRGGTAESYEVVGADAFAGVAAVTASGAESPVVPPRTASIGPRDSPKRTMTPPSTSRFVGGGQGTLRRRAATAAGGHAGVAR